MQIATRTRDDVLVVEMAGRLDTYTVGDAVDRLLAIAEGPALRVILQLRRLDYISSTGLHAVLRVAKRLCARGGELVIAEAHGNVAAALEASGLDALIRLLPTEHAALRALLPPAGAPPAGTPPGGRPHQGDVLPGDGGR